MNILKSDLYTLNSKIEKRKQKGRFLLLQLFQRGTSAYAILIKSAVSRSSYKCFPLTICLFQFNYTSCIVIRTKRRFQHLAWTNINFRLLCPLASAQCFVKLPASYSKHLNGADLAFQLADIGSMACLYRLSVMFASMSDLGVASYSHQLPNAVLHWEL